MNVAMLSKWHVHAEGMANELLALGVNITKVWDEDPIRGKEWADELGATFEEELTKCVQSDDIDAVICYAPTTMHKQVLIAAANAGKHIFTEKALATTVAECEEIAQAIKENDVKFVISFPMRTNPEVLYVKEMIDTNKLGDITLIRIRNGHNGSSKNWLPEYWYDESLAGGGAMMDLGCHPMYTLNYLLGEPKRISSLFTTHCDRPVDDAAICMIEFKNGAAALAETSLVVHNAPPALEVYGTEGTIIMREDKLYMSSTAMDEVNRGYIEVTSLPKALPSPIKMFLDAIENDTEPLFGLDAAIGLTALLENAYISHEKGTFVDFK